MKKFCKIFTVLIFIFLYLPMIVLGVASFNTGTDVATWESFTLGQYKALFQDHTLLPLLGNSFLIAIVAAVIATILGTIGSGRHSLHAPPPQSFGHDPDQHSHDQPGYRHRCFSGAAVCLCGHGAEEKPRHGLFHPADRSRHL